MLKPIAIIAALALALTVPAASLADHGHAKKPCPTVGNGKAKAKGHAKGAKPTSGKDRKCRHEKRPTPPLATPAG